MNRSVVFYLWLLYLYLPSSLMGCSLILEPRYYRSLPEAGPSPDGTAFADGAVVPDVALDRGTADVPETDTFDMPDRSEDGFALDAPDEGTADAVSSFDAASDGFGPDLGVETGLGVDAGLDIAEAGMADVQDVARPDAIDVVDAGMRPDALDVQDIIDAAGDVPSDVPLDVPVEPAFPVTLLFRLDGIAPVADFFIRYQLPGEVRSSWERGHCLGGVSTVIMGGFAWSSCVTDRAYPAMTGFDFYPIYGDARPVCGMGECVPVNLSDRGNAIWQGHRFAGSMLPYPVYLFFEAIGPGMNRNYLNITLR